MRGALALVGALAATLVLGACGGDEGQQPTVFAAASLSEVFAELEGARYSFAGSDELAAQIRQGAPADVYVAANRELPEELYAEGLVQEPLAFATNRLVVVVPAGNPAGIESVADLSRPDVRLALGDPEVPVGAYTRQVLENLGAAGVLANVVTEEPDVKSVVAKITLGVADAGFVYATDARPVEDQVEVIELPAEAQPAIEYLVAVVTTTGRPEAAAAFVGRVLGDEGRAALEKAGFGVP